MFQQKKSDEVDLVVQPLSRTQRKLLFFSLITIFVISVPVFVFNAIGYRYDFFDPNGSIVSTGALYVTVPDTSAQIYVDEQEVRDARVFRRASYIQYLSPGMHRVHVTAENQHTWVKELPVYPHIVTEAEAFLLPLRPQLRMVTPYINTINNAPLVDKKQFAFILDTASTTLPIEILISTTTTKTVNTATTTTETQKPEVNPEYAVLEELFSDNASSTLSLAERAIDTAKQAFRFQTTDTSVVADSDYGNTIEIATIKTKGALTLFRRGEDIFVSYNGNLRDIPYYFCVPQASIASTTEVYGAHVMMGINAAIADSTDGFTTETSNSNRICRQEIKIDRQGAQVHTFDFANVGSEAVITHRTNGVFVTEIDDRSWQNTQKIYGASAETMIVDNGRVYIKDRQDFYAELLTNLIIGNK